MFGIKPLEKDVWDSEHFILRRCIQSVGSSAIVTYPSREMQTALSAISPSSTNTSA
jgi:hypothetical protein